MHAVSFSPSSGGWVSTLRLPALILLGWALACLPVLEWWAARFDDGSDEPLGAVALACALGLLWSQQERLQVSLGGLSMGLLLIAMQVVLPLPMML